MAGGRNFVSLMVHIFSLGYMKGEERFGTYYSFLSLFTFSMLGLVRCIKHFPDLYFLGTGWCIVLFIDRFLL
jgi:NADH:ubiquinone oxidoreductase subunit 5 (subunit L)/multisubunit Na+/H+ antiporter MnhA subunit